MYLKKWHSTSISSVYDILKTNSFGLSNNEAKKRLVKYGNNELPKKRNKTLIELFLKELLDPIVILLLAAMIISFLIGEKIDALVILFIVLVDAIIGTLEERKANKNVLALNNLIKMSSVVLRDNKEYEIDARFIVPGDILLLESGDKVSADIRLIKSSNLIIDESLLTGESVSVEKNPDVINKDVELIERKNMVYAGTSVLKGRAIGVVTATGTNTELGKIASSVNNTKETKSPLTIRMERFSKQISILLILVAIILAFVLYIKGVPNNEIFLSVIALSVSAMPEGLPLALTMALTIGANRMSKKNVIVKKLYSVESLGSCTVIATDKTGTLTLNEQTAKKIVLPDDSLYDITGIGYNDEGKIVCSKKSNILDAYYISKLGVINNEATLEKENGTFKHIGDLIDVAFLSLGLKANVKCDVKILNRVPYESEKKYSAVFYKEKEDIHCTIKGSIETVLNFCSSIKINDKNIKLDKEKIKSQNEKLAKEGYRVIALADGVVNDVDISKISDLTFVGLVAFIDPVRKDAKKSIEECEKAGIKVTMVTGDHPLTALAIAKELNMASSIDDVATGTEIDEYLSKGEEAFDDFVRNKKVFTRVTPLNKLEIVESYKRQGEFVSVTGDGVNDAPAIKAANIGIAMGNGTDVAKETASMILLNNDFSSIVVGIKEGRNAYSNIRKVSYMLLSCGVAEVLFFIMSIILNLPMPLVAVQLLWLNIVTDGLQDFALSFEKIENDTMNEKPRNPKETLFNKDLIKEVLLSGFTMGIIVLTTWIYLLKKLNMPVIVARGYIMMLMVFIQNMHVLNCRSEKNTLFSVPLKSNPLILFSIIGAISLQIIFSEVPTLSVFLKTTSISVLDMLKLFLLSTIIIFVMELYKIINKLKTKKCK